MCRHPNFDLRAHFWIPNDEKKWSEWTLEQRTSRWRSQLWSTVPCCTKFSREALLTLPCVSLSHQNFLGFTLLPHDRVIVPHGRVSCTAQHNFVPQDRVARQIKKFAEPTFSPFCWLWRPHIIMISCKDQSLSLAHHYFEWAPGLRANQSLRCP